MLFSDPCLPMTPCHHQAYPMITYTHSITNFLSTETFVLGDCKQIHIHEHIHVARACIISTCRCELCGSNLRIAVAFVTSHKLAHKTQETKCGKHSLHDFCGLAWMVWYKYKVRCFSSSIHDHVISLTCTCTYSVSAHYHNKSH